MPLLTDPTASGCPTPLSWQQVLESLDEQASRHELPGSTGGRILLRTIGHGPPLVLLGPLLGSWRLMALFAWLMKDDYQCVLYDDSSLASRTPPSRPGQIDDLVEDLWRVQEHIGHQPLSLFGTGLGATIGLAAVAEEPARIASAVLQGLVTRTRLTRAERWLACLGGLLPGSLARVPGFRSLMVHNHQAWFPPFDQTRLAFAIDVIGETPLKTAARRTRRLDGLSLPSPRIDHDDTRRVPLLLVVPESQYSPGGDAASDAGVLVSAETLAMLELWPGAEVDALAGCGPLGCLTHPHRLAKLVRDFMQERVVSPATSRDSH